MDVLLGKLEDLKGDEVVVVMSDQRAFRGTLTDYDSRCIVLHSVVEGTTDNAHGWEEPTVTTGLVHKVVSWQGVFSHEDNDAEVIRLKDVVIHLPGVLRIWSWNTANREEPSHVEVSHSTGSTVNRARRKGKPFPQ